MTEPVVVDSWRPLGAVLVSAIAAVLIFLSASRPDVRESWSMLAALTKFGIIASMVPGVLDGYIYETHVASIFPGFELALRADPLGMIFGVLASGLWVLAAAYCVGYMRGLDEHAQTRFYVTYTLSLTAAIGISFAENLFVLLLFYEVLTIVTYPLVAHDETVEAKSIGAKYLVYTVGSGILVFGGAIVALWLSALDPSTGSVVWADATVSFTTGGIDTIIETAEEHVWLARIAFGLLVTGFAVKAAVMPLHSWLPDAMIAPTPVSGLLHAVAVVKAGAFGVSRVMIDVFGIDLVGALGVDVLVAIGAGFTILAASFLALKQNDLKARLAYSTIAQLSYIVFGLALLTPAALVGALMHFPAHAFAKLTLFFCAGAIYVETHTKKIDKMAGIAKRMPITMAVFGVASLSMAGIPFFGGFVSKFNLVLGGFEAYGPVVPLLLGLSGVLNIAYFWPIVYTAFFESKDDANAKPLVHGEMGGERVRTDGGKSGWERYRPDGSEATPFLLVPLLGTVTLAFLLGVIPDQLFFFGAAESIVDGLTGVGAE